MTKSRKLSRAQVLALRRANYERVANHVIPTARTWASLRDRGLVDDREQLTDAGRAALYEINGGRCRWSWRDASMMLRTCVVTDTAEHVHRDYDGTEYCGMTR